MPRSRIILSCALVVVGGACAHDPYAPPTTTWGEAGGGQGSSAAPADAPPAGGKMLTAKEYADRFKTSAECEFEARRLAAQDEKQGLALFRACLDRIDFVQLEPFYTDPWRAALADTQGKLQLARVIANRGGSVSADLRELLNERVVVPTLQEVVDAGSRARGKVIIARLRYIGPRKDVRGELVFEEATITPEEDLEDDAASEALERSAGLPFASVLTGQRAVLELSDQATPLPEGEELVVIAEFLGTEKLFNEDLNEEQDVALLRVLARHRPSDRIRG